MCVSNGLSPVWKRPFQSFCIQRKETNRMPRKCGKGKSAMLGDIKSEILGDVNLSCVQKLLE